MWSPRGTSRRFPMYRGAIALGDEFPAPALPSHLAECLRAAGAWETRVEGNRVTFSGSAMPPVFSFKWPTFCPFGRGELGVDSAAHLLHYRLRVAHLTAYATVGTACLGALMLAAPFHPLVVALFLPLAWLLPTGGYLLIGVPHFQAFLRQSLATPPGPENGPAIPQLPHS